ncbi:MAG: tRNA-dihydrouridine synthase [Butyrivibrio sp.]|uniref:tRNA dihydrouridine synthase n=1 Tax=Butyrivibrio sp. TaxID=28121 RepID=UPI0025DD1E38|nr:tRNA-dihydrouridine synthase [Butyrivibrio sp.]MCR5771658.1 tRNA-dihydrouridine synthase [Butyrivibrio sp.]
MNIYYAPMEGITTYLYRQLHNEYFGGVDKYFTPFISVFPDHYIKKRDEREIDPANNEGMNVVPQVLANSSTEFIWIFKKLISMGYDEVNLNLGCPSGTVTAKGRGSGFLRDPDKLDTFFDEVFDSLGDEAKKLSVKTRIGYLEASEMEQLSKIYAKYPIKELTIHPRLRKQFYKGVPDMEVFEKALIESSCPVCYNGNVFTLSDYNDINQKYGYSLDNNAISNNSIQNKSNDDLKTNDIIGIYHKNTSGCTDNKISSVMLGRGIVADPSLGRQIKGGAQMTKAEFKEFRRALENMYKEHLKDSHNVHNKMKEMWFYMSQSFEGTDKYIKNILKSKSFSEYQAAVNTLEGNCEIKSGPNASPVSF